MFGYMDNFNKSQKRIIYVAIALILWMGLVPPWHAHVHANNVVSSVNLGYEFITDPPTYVLPYNSTARFGGEITFSTLLMQWVVVAGIAAALVYWKRDPWAIRPVPKK